MHGRRPTSKCPLRALWVSGSLAKRQDITCPVCFISFYTLLWKEEPRKQMGSPSAQFVKAQSYKGHPRMTEILGSNREGRGYGSSAGLQREEI